MHQLAKIIEYKKQEVQLKKSRSPLETTSYIPKDFAQALKNNSPAIIAEIKKASPSKGIIREDFEPALIAKQYTQAGAACLSVLTDEHFFQGSNEYLKQVRAVTDLPILRKDFTVDEYQIHEAKALGADCILLIVAALDPEELNDFHQIAYSIGLQVLIETHDEQELETALKLSTPLIGINNRNLKTFKTDITNSLNLSHIIPNDRIIISESGIHHKDDIQRLQQANINSFLIGEHFMRAQNPGEALAEFV